MRRLRAHLAQPEGETMRRITVALLLAAAVAPAAVMPVAAAAPTHDRYDVHEIGVLDEPASDACGFDVWTDNIGHVTYKVFSDRDGNPRREIDNYAIRSREYTDFGSFWLVNAGPDRITYLDDGSIIDTTIGNIGSFSAKGQGRVYSDVGWTRYHVTFDEDGNPTFEFLGAAGVHDIDITAVLCPLLAQPAP